MKKDLERFTYGEKVIFIPEMKVYDFGYPTQAGKVVIYNEGERNMQDSYVVNIEDLRRDLRKKK